MKFQVNEGSIDRLIRFLLGIGLFAAAAAGLVTAPVLFVALVLGTIGVITGITGFCPTYVLLGISTVMNDSGAGSSEP